jgi:hypothetical protein
MAVWPATLPQYVLAANYTEAVPDNSIRSETDVGPAKVRRRGTAAPRPISCQVLLTTAQRATLDDFYNTDTKAGSLTWTWVHPVTRAAATFRFVEPISFSATARGQLFTAALSLEIVA